MINPIIASNLTDLYDKPKAVNLNSSSSDKELAFDKEVAVAIIFLGFVVTCVILIYASVLCKLLIGRTKPAKKKLTGSELSDRSSILKRDSIIDHELAIDALKKKPSKSILVSSRQSMQGNRSSRVFDSQDISSLNGFRHSFYGNDDENDDVSDFKESYAEDEAVLNRKSGMSLKSVTFNEKTQIRRIKPKKKHKTT
jgi:hypothetical protein